MRDIIELIGLVKAIDYDHIINEKEVERIKNWVDKNRNLAYDKRKIDMISLLDDVLEDQIITEEEKRNVLAHAERILYEDNTEYNCIYELRGIIEGIICDEEVNEKEAYRLKEWLESNRSLVLGHKISRRVYATIEDILEDGVITEEEHILLLEELNNSADKIRLETKIDYLRKHVREHRNIGLELISLLDNENAISVINKKAEGQLRSALNAYVGASMDDPEIVFISLSLIGMLGYDGNYYDSVRKYYSDLYDDFSDQKIAGLIRSIIYRFREELKSEEQSKRIITTVLKQSIVPAYFLDNFFEFIFDIYKLNFDYELPEYPYDDFSFAFTGLKKSMLSDGDDLKLNVTKKSYKLIKSTKEIVTDEKQIDSIINLSIIVAKLIDQKIWSDRPVLSNPYLKQGFEKWEEHFESSQERRDRKKKGKGLFSRWRPNYYLEDNSVFIVPPIHRIKSTYNYQDIRIVIYNDDEMVYADEEPDIREIIGGYQVTSDKIAIEKPLGKLRYMLLAGEEEIYDSKDELYRSYIVFNQNSSELKNNTNYNGIALICGQEGCIDEEPYCVKEYYSLFSKAVEYEDVLLIQGDVFGFSSLIKPGVFGNRLENHFLKDTVSGKLIPVFSSVEQLVFESNAEAESINVTINGERYSLDHFEYKCFGRKSAVKYIVDFNLTKPDLYTVSVNCNAKQLATFVFAWDDLFSVEVSRLDDSSYSFSIKSSLTERDVEKEIDIYDYDFEWFIIRNRGHEYAYIIPLNISMYQIDESSVKPFAEDLWIEEIKHDSVIRFYGIDADSVMVYSDKGEVLQEPFAIKKCDYYFEMSVSFLLTFKQNNEFVYIYLIKAGRVSNLLVCYNKCSMNKEYTEFTFDPATGKLIIIPVFHGKGNISMVIRNKAGKEVFKKEKVKSGVGFGLKGLRSFTDYNISFCEKPKGLLIGGKERVFYSVTKRFVSWGDMVKHAFRIKEVNYDLFWRGELQNKKHYFNNVYVEITERLSEDEFEGKIYVRIKDKKYYTHHINPVRVEICSDVIFDEIELSITKDGDGLLLDTKHHQVMNTMDNDRAPDIFSYIIDVRGEK